MAKLKDPVAAAKLVAKITRCPLPMVAQVFQKYPLEDKNLEKIRKECLALAAREMEKELKAMGL
jgi:hypothetical protein